MPFSGALAHSEMQTALFRIWTLVADSISSDDNHNTKCAPQNHYSQLVGIIEYGECISTEG